MSSGSRRRFRVGRGTWLSLTACGLALGLPRPARAEPVVAPSGLAQQPPERHWYGWQTLASDGAGVALLVAGAGSRNDTVIALGVGAGLATLALGAPSVHVAHGRVGIGLLSLGMRIAVPGLAALALNQPCRGECSEQALIVLLIPAPIALDAAVLAWETPEPRTTSVSLRVAPGVLPGGGSALCVSGGF